MSKETWTPRDEAQLKELQERREKVLVHRRSESARMLQAFFIDLADRSLHQLAVIDAMIKHADIIRDALEPYDSGVRTMATAACSVCKGSLDQCPSVNLRLNGICPN